MTPALNLVVFRRRRRTNKCRNFNANPTVTTNVSKSGAAEAVLSIVDDSAALAAAQLSGTATSGNVYKLDNSLGGGAAYATISGSVGNTSPHSASAYIRGGTGRLFIDDSTGGAFPASAGYVRVKQEAVIPVNSTRQLLIQADAGQVIYFILNQLEEGAIATAVIVVSGAAVTV